jgi:putative tryptophan/tyrosine transport system substrate-binding protein
MMNAQLRVALRGLVLLGVAIAWTMSAAADPIRVGIAQWGRHPQLDTVTSSFKEELGKLGFVEGKDVVYDLEVANFDTSVLPQILNKLKSASPKLILTISTPVAQAAKQTLKGAGIPIVFAAITDPIKAKLVASWDAGAEDMSGSSDQQDADAVLDFVHQLLPSLRLLGFIYNPGEDNNLSMLERLQKAAPQHGMQIAEAGADNAADIPARVASLKGRAEAIFVPTGGMMQPAIPAIAASASQVQLPVINSAVEVARSGLVLAGFAVNYDRVGRDAAGIAAQILKGARPASLPPVRVLRSDYSVVVSGKQLKRLNMALPAGLANCSCVAD